MDDGCVDGWQDGCDVGFGTVGTTSSQGTNCTNEFDRNVNERAQTLPKLLKKKCVLSTSMF